MGFDGTRMVYLYYNSQMSIVIYQTDSVQPHTASSDTIFIQIYMDAFPWFKKIRFFLQITLLSSWANIAPKRHKLRKIVKIEKICKKKPLFSTVWGKS